jgi:hypothetical protein
MRCFSSTGRFSLIFVGSIVAALAFSSSAQALCSSPLAGRWGPNSQAVANSDPGFIDINFMSCGDTNTQPNTAFGTRVWVQQSTGKWFGRPRVKANFVNSQGHQWLLAKVPTGGYVDQMFMRVENGELVVFIRHKSLDSKPDASDWYRYAKKS